MICVPRFYPGAGPAGGSASAADGSLDYPYQATGADYAAVQTALGALSASDGEFAIAFIAGGAEYLLQYVSADTAWYAPDGGDGSQLSPYWTATASGSGALDSLPVGAADDYAVIAKGTGSPVTVRCRAITATTSGYTSTVWVPAAVYALGAPTTADVADGYPDPARMVVTVPINSTALETGGRLRQSRSTGIGTQNIATTASRGAASHLAMFFTGFATSGVTTSGAENFCGVRTTTDSNQGLFCSWGGAVSPSGQITKMNAYNSSGVLVDTGVLLASLTYWCVTLDTSTDLLTIWSDGASVYTVTSTITSGTTVRATLQTGEGTSLYIEQAIFAACTWT